MNLEDLMEVWRSQDAAPLHGVNETLLRLALRQDEAKLRARRRREMWFTYIGMAVLVGLTALFLAVMIYPNDDDVLSGWDYIVAVVGLAAALILSRMIYVGHRAQTRREQRFGESLRDQVNRQIAMIDPFLTFSWVDRKNVAIFVLGFGVAAAINFLAARINDKPYEEAWLWVRGGILYSLIGIGIVGWWLRRWVRRDLAPRKRRLEALLKELDG
jgi:O-antigen/teichoic acid export membrane protein